jgi:hypothetical protein
MNTKFLLGLFAAAILVSGCAKTETGTRTAAVPFVNDSATGRYERTPDQVFKASKAVLSSNGTVVNEVTQHNAGNDVVLALEGRVRERKVFVGVKAIDAKVTEVTVQVRTSGGGTDMDLAYELEKQIALKLVH